MIVFSEVFMTHRNRVVKDDSLDENGQPDNEKGTKVVNSMLMDEHERFGLRPFKKDHLF